MLLEEQFKRNLTEVKNEIGEFCSEFNRSPEEVVLLPVTKQWPVESVRFCKNAGIRSVGENRVQDALAKQVEVTGVDWELIGHLQSNKVNQVIGRFERIQTVDSLKLLDKLQVAAERRELRQKILIQVNSGEDPAKFGLFMDEVDEMLERALGCANLITEGFMTIAPYAPENPSVAQRAFIRLRELRDRLNEDFQVDLGELSMGMSGDIREAIESGSTMVRLGTALFGARKE